MFDMKEVVIIGAGACGLMAAHILAERGHKVQVLEARDRTGGRIHTMRSGFSLPVEFGAEFVHGEQPLTNSLLKESASEKKLLDGKRYQLWDGSLDKGDFFGGDWTKVTRKLKHLEKDTDMQSFLDTYFPDEKYEGLRKKVKGFVEGYDAADMERVSALALREEWSGSDDDHQYHVSGGYSVIIDFLEKRFREAGGKILLSSPVVEIHWGGGKIALVTARGEEHNAEKVIVTIPLGVLRKGGVKFFPSIPRQEAAFRSMGFGGVAKFFFEFKSAFWEDRGRTLKKMAFVFSDAEIPTWWTQRPDNTPLITGWLGGPPTWTLPNSKDLLFDKAQQSLRYIFHCSSEEITSQILQWDIVNWVHDPHTLGSYAYPTTETRHALELIHEPIDDLVYFAGEAIYNGPAIGTVEAALYSGKEVAGKI